MAGNESTQLTRNWEVLNENSAYEVVSILSAPNHPTSNTHATFIFSVENANGYFQCALDGTNNFSSCNVSQTYSNLATNSSHALQVRFEPLGFSGNADVLPVTTFEWFIDSQEPQTEITEGPGNTSGQSVLFRLSCSDNFWLWWL